MTTAQIEAGTLTASLDDRTVTGLLLPWDEVGNSNLGKFAVERDAVTIPRDITIVGLNDVHKREEPLGRATAVTNTPAGIVATFAVADTDEGDQYLLDVAAGKRNRLSAEVKNIVLRSGKAVAGALFGAAAVEKGAFPSAALMAEDVGDTLEAALTDEDQATIADLAAQITEIAAQDSAPSGEDTTNTLEAAVADAQGAAKVPTTGKAVATAKPRTTVREVAHALAMFHAGNGRTELDAIVEKDGSTLFGALVDVTTAANPAILQPQWIGDVWGARTYQRKIVPLLSQAALTSLKIVGFRFTQGPIGGPWAGDKTAVPSGPVTTEEVIENALRWAGGNDIAREFLDFSTPEFWTSYLAYLFNDYAEYSDDKTLEILLDLAEPVTAGTVPAGVNAATVLLADGALAVLAADGTPTFAVAAPDVYRGLLLQPSNEIIATLALSTGLEEANFAGFTVVSDPQVPAGKVLVGDRAAATFYELPGVPIRTTALDQIKGGVDEVAFGYFAVMVNNSHGLALVGAGVGAAAARSKKDSE